MTVNWRDCAAEVKTISGPSWRVALLVAVCVPTQATIAEFAKEAGTSGSRLVRHKKAWAAAVKAGLVPRKPNVFCELPTEPFNQFYDGSNAATGGHKPDSVLAKALADASPAQRRKLIKEQRELLAAQGPKKRTAVEIEAERKDRERADPARVAGSDLRTAAFLVRNARDLMIKAVGKVNDAAALGVELDDLPFAASALRDLEEGSTEIVDAALTVVRYVQSGSVSGQAEEWLAQQPD